MTSATLEHKKKPDSRWIGRKNMLTTPSTLPWVESNFLGARRTIIPIRYVPWKRFMMTIGTNSVWAKTCATTMETNFITMP